MIIGITGTLGAGKGTIVKYLVHQHNFIHCSVRDFLKEELDRRNLPHDRDTMTDLANELRAEHDPAYIVAQLLREAKEHGGNAVIESIRTPGEAQYLKEHGARIWAVDADIETRYKRIADRASETDMVSFAEFTKDELREFKSTDPHKQNIQAVMELADATFENTGSLENLYAQVRNEFHKNREE